jgi:predicted DNA-binding transcriptional regulator AlpA
MTINDQEAATTDDRPSLHDPCTTTEEVTTMNHTERLLTIAEVAERLNVSVATMRWRRHLGLPPHPIKVGRVLRYPESDVDAYIGSLVEEERKRRRDRLAARSRAVRHDIESGKDARANVRTRG